MKKRDIPYSSEICGISYIAPVKDVKDGTLLKNDTLGEEWRT
jgi:hypothetical protein